LIEPLNDNSTLNQSGHLNLKAFAEVVLQQPNASLAVGIKNRPAEPGIV